MSSAMNNGYSNYKLFRVEVRPDGVALVVLDNPPVNAVSVGVTAEMAALLPQLDKDEAVRAIVLTGKGTKAFCAGSDIKEFAAFENVTEQKMKPENAAYDLFERISKPVIGALEGIVYGGGCELALCCDIRIAGETAKFAMPEITLGLVPGTGGMHRLPKIVGLNKALEMMFTGDPLTAQEALTWGLVNKVVPAGTAQEAALEMAGRIAEKSAVALATIKKNAREMLTRSRDEAFWRNIEMFTPVYDSPERKEGCAAFVEKRKPKFH